MERYSYNKLFFITFILILSITINAQDRSPHNGRVPKMKRMHTIHFIQTPISSDNDCKAYGWSSINNKTLSMPIPEGTPFTWLGPWTPPVFASSAVRGPDGTYYVIDIGPPGTLWTLNPTTGAMTELGIINGIESGGSPNGIAYDAVNNTFYLAAGVFTVTNKLYSFDPATLTATVIGSFPNPNGAMIDIAINGSGIGYGFDIVDDNAYKFDPGTGVSTLLGPLGYDAYYGQGMDIKPDDGTIFLSAFNNTTFTGQLRTMDPGTGATALIVDWGFEQIAPFAFTWCYPPPPGPGQATNPNPISGATDITLDAQLSWTNPSGATSIDVLFGTEQGSLTSIYSGTPIITVNPGTLNYFTTYYWKVNETDITGTTTGSMWNFKTMQNPAYIIDSMKVYPQNITYWTGNTAGLTKTDDEINTIYPNVGWAVFDISSLPQNIFLIDSVRFYGYVDSTNWPYWSATPMGSINPVNASAADINNQILNNYNQPPAYIFCDETAAFTNGWHNYLLSSNAIEDIINQHNNGNDWFAMGFVDRDFTSDYFINFGGHTGSNLPYLQIHYVAAPLPVELIYFDANTDGSDITLNWSTASETNNKGFYVERKFRTNDYSEVAFIKGNGTSTQTNTYSFKDKNLIDGTYTYRIKQLDYDGKYEYSRSVKVSINAPKVFSLSQNYPDPFNPATTIKYSIPSDGPVSLQIYDLLGREVKTLVNENQKAGDYTFKFDGSSLSSGVYIYRIQTGKLSSSKKMILLK